MRVKNFINWAKILVIPICVWLILGATLLTKTCQVNKLNKRIRYLTQEINQTYAAFGGEKNFKEQLIIMHTEFSKLNSAFSREQNIAQAIKALSEEAKRNGILVSSIRPEQIGTCRDCNGQEIKFGDSLCSYLPIRISGQARYRQIGEFLNSLKETFRFLVTVEGLNIERPKDIEPDLKFELFINTYLK